MSSIQSAVIRFFLKRSDLWNKLLPEIRKKMEMIKGTGIPCEVFLVDGSKNNKANEIKIWEKMLHIFPMQAVLFPEAEKALNEICEFIKREISNCRDESAEIKGQ